MSSGKSKTQTTTSTTAPPAYVGNQLEFGVGEARRLYNAGTPEFFPGQTYAGFTPQQETALGLAEQRAMRGSPLVQGAQQNLFDTLSGKYMGSNPYLEAEINAASRGTTQRFAESVLPGIQSSLGRAGRYGANAATLNMYDRAQQNLARELGDIEATTRSRSYDNERARQFQALGLAPSLASQDYADIAQLSAVGEQRQAMNQRAIDESMQRYQYENTIDQQALDQFLARISGVAGSAGTIGTQTTPVQKSSPFSQALGLGLTAAGYAFGGPAGGMMGSMAGNAFGGGFGGYSPVPMATYGGGAYGGGYSMTPGGTRISWY